MKLPTRHDVKTQLAWAILLGVFITTGCSTPPSVAPLLRVAERALIEESERLEADARRDAEQMRGDLATLEDGFNRDLEQAEALTPQWVREATSVYVSARETVVRYQNAQIRDLNNRADNLKLAASATGRAISLVERQDRLFDGVLNEELQRLISVTDWNPQEPGR